MRRTSQRKHWKGHPAAVVTASINYTRHSRGAVRRILPGLQGEGCCHPPCADEATEAWRG